MIASLIGSAVAVILTLLGVAWKAGRSLAMKTDLEKMRVENVKAHDGITARIDGVDHRSQQRDDAQRAVLDAIARDVSFMAGRQAERDKGNTTR